MQVVTACAVLHNICVGVGDELPVEDGAMEGDDPPLEEECGTEPQSGAPWRAALEIGRASCRERVCQYV